MHSASNGFSPFRAGVRVFLLIAWVLVSFLPMVMVWALGIDRLRGHMVRGYYAVCGLISGIKLVRKGEVDSTRPLMMVANHTSYLDIFVLGSLVPLSFTPKMEIRSWPVIGFFCIIADCVFVERRPAEMHAAREAMEARLKRGKVLCLFPEGTTGDGKNIMKFKSGFFSLAEEHHLPVQPVAVAYTHIGSEPLSAARRLEVSWIGDASFFPHFVHLLGLPSVSVEVTILPLQNLADFEDRKALAKSCEDTIRTNLERTLEQYGVS